MKQVGLFSFLVFAAMTSKPQVSGTRTINTTGSTASAGGLVLEWSVGEMVAVQTLTSPNVVLTQGLLQPGVSSSAPLPVTLLFFTAKAVNGQTILSWATSQETNNHHFDIERSSNGVDFQRFEQAAGAGNSSIPKMYSVTDPTPYSSTYYRLKQVDVDGNYRYSTIIQFQLSLILVYGLYPNPTEGHLYLALNGSAKIAEISVMDMNGRVVLRKIIYPTATVQLDVSHLPSGSYFMAVQSSGAIWSGKFMKR